MEIEVSKKRPFFGHFLIADFMVYTKYFTVSDENAFCCIKHYRGIATRYEMLKRNYQNLVALAFAYHWLKL